MRRPVIVSMLTLLLMACGDDSVSSTPAETMDRADASGDSSAAFDTTPTADASKPIEGAFEADLAFLREEEKLARDTYLTLNETWNIRVFANIARSEQAHMDAVKAELVARGLEDPIKNDLRGAFVNPELAKLYSDLVAQGSKSSIDALKVGATIEDLDLKDIAEMAVNTSDEGAKTMLASLACGSRNHMRAFVGQLTQQGATYTAQFISPQELAQIVSSDRETCSGEP